MLKYIFHLRNALLITLSVTMCGSKCKKTVTIGENPILNSAGEL